MQRPEQDEFICPGERQPISRAICRTRQRNQYPKCLLCPHRSEEIAGASARDPKVPGGIFRSTRVLGYAPQHINEYVVRKVGLGAAQLLRAESPRGAQLVVACDARENSRGFARIFCDGANRGGMDTLYVGEVPPEVLIHALAGLGGTGAAFIGGGNAADNVNGIRLWHADGSLLGLGTGLEKVAAIVRRLRMAWSRVPGSRNSADAVGDYAAYVLKFAPRLGETRVLIDGGHGTAGGVLRKVFAGTSVQVVEARFEPDPHGPYLGRAFPCGPLTSAMRGRVREERAALGVAVDFTGERVAFFDERGTLMPHDVAACLLAREALVRVPESTVAHDVRATAALRGAVRAAGGTAVAAPVARLAFERALRRADAAYGADMTGLHFFRDFHRSASPVVAMLYMLSYLAREGGRASELAAPFAQLARSGEVAIELPDRDQADAVLARVRDEYAEADREQVDGLTVRFQDWWFNLRQPAGASELRLNVEGRASRDERRGRQTVEKLVRAIIAEAGS